MRAGPACGPASRAGATSRTPPSSRGLCDCKRGAAPGPHTTPKCPLSVVPVQAGPPWTGISYGLTSLDLQNSNKLAVPVTTETVDIPEWRLIGDWWDFCNCAIGCPCNFGSDPTLGYCEGVLTWLIR